MVPKNPRLKQSEEYLSGDPLKSKDGEAVTD
jgi:hypothetical protein